MKDYKMTKADVRALSLCLSPAPEDLIPDGARPDKLVEIGALEETELGGVKAYRTTQHGLGLLSAAGAFETLLEAIYGHEPR